MNDEIKEILEYLKNNFYAYGETYIEEKCKIVTKKEKQQLLDYITNLQEEINKLTAESTEWESKFYDMQGNFHNANEEIERLKEENTILKENAEHNDKVVNKTRWNEMIYKSRCEKAIEHIKEHQLIYTSQYEEESNFDNHLLDILNGGDEGGLTVRYNKDGKIRTNKKCLEEKQKNSDK